MLEGLQVQIQATQQPSPSLSYFSNPTTEATPIPYPIGDHANEEHSPIPMTSPSPVCEECGTEEPLFDEDPTQVNTRVDAQIDVPGHQSM